MVRYAPRSGGGFYGALGGLARGALNAYSKSKRRRTQQASNSDDKPAPAAYGTPSTFQNDRINLWSKRRRRGSKRSKRAARKFRSRVKSVIYSQLGTKCLTRTNQGVENAPINTLANLAFLVNGSNDGSYSDLFRVMADFNQNGAPQTRADNLLMRSTLAQLTMANKTGNGTVMYCTLYYFTCRKNLPVTDSSVIVKYVTSFTQNTVLPSSTGVSAANNTATPFMAGTWCQHFLITKIVRITLADGQQTTLDMRFNKKFMVRNETVQDNCAIKGITRGVLVVFHGGLSNTGDMDPCTMSWKFNRSYYGVHNVEAYNALGQD